MAAIDDATNTKLELDEVLIERIRRGDADAFDIVYDRYFDRVYRFVMKRLNNHADTEETVQEVFINIFSSIGGFRGEASFAAWIFGLTRHTISARFKKKRHATVPLEEEYDEQPTAGYGCAPRSEATPLEALECTERLSRLESAIHTKLSEDQRDLFRLHHLENRPIGEIARSLNKSQNAVKSNLYRARKILLAR